MSPATLVNRLNRRWREGTPSNDLQKAGVVVAVLDGDEDPKHPWVRVGLMSGYQPRDRVSASIVNARHPDCYWHYFSPGSVLRADLVQTRLRCSYPVDVGSFSVAKDQMHGCDATSYGRAQTYEMLLEQDRRTPAGPRGCQPKEVGGAEPSCGYQTFGYNECILDNSRGNRWSEDVPDIIEAIFVQARSGTSMIDYGKRFHRDFNAAFGARANRPNVPLLQYDWAHRTEPFSLFDSS